MSLGIDYEFRPTDNLICAGALSPEAVTRAAAEDVVQIINLCPPAEMSWDEEGTAQKLGLTYHNIPVAGPQDLNDANAERLLELLDGAPGKSLVHCASSNRVGALLALAAQKKGASVDDALSVGRSGGLTRMEPIVAELLSQRSTNS
ncbi:MAG: sulfur transferase domain-containing protein [Oceanococcaceae bacterium]